MIPESAQSILFNWKIKIESPISRRFRHGCRQCRYSSPRLVASNLFVVVIPILFQAGKNGYCVRKPHTFPATKVFPKHFVLGRLRLKCSMLGSRPWPRKWCTSFSFMLFLARLCNPIKRATCSPVVYRSGVATVMLGWLCMPTCGC
jgi:hypothetical protein